MYYAETRLRGLGVGVKAKVVLPPEVKAAAAAFPGFRESFDRATQVADQTQVYLPYFYLGAAALIVWVVITKATK